MVYWESAETFHCAACGAELAAEDLGYDVSHVRDALRRVGALCANCE